MFYVPDIEAMCPVRGTGQLLIVMKHRRGDLPPWPEVAVSVSARLLQWQSATPEASAPGQVPTASSWQRNEEPSLLLSYHQISSSGDMQEGVWLVATSPPTGCRVAASDH